MSVNALLHGADGTASGQSLELGRTPHRFDVRLAAALVVGAVYGLVLWGLGWAVSWGLRDAASGAVVGAAAGIFYAFREGTLSLWIVAGWTAGGAAGTLLFQGIAAAAVDPLTGAMAWPVAGAIGRAVSFSLNGGRKPTGEPSHVIPGVVGAGVGWPLAGLITAAATMQVDLPWSWALAGLMAGGLAGFLEESGRGASRALANAVMKGALGGVLGLGAGLISGASGDPLGWILSGALVCVLPGFFATGGDRHTQPVWSVAFSPSGALVLSASSDSGLGLWHIEDLSLVAMVRPHGGPVHAVAFSHDGDHCISGGDDANVRIVSGATGDEVLCLSGHTDTVLAVAFAPDDDSAASASADATVRLWDLSPGREKSCLTGHSAPVTAVAFTPDGRVLASAGLDGTVRLWEVLGGKETARLDVLSPVHAVAISRDAGQALIAADNGLRLWDVSAGRPLREFAGHVGPVHSLSLGADDRRFLSAAADGTVRLWDRHTGQELACIRGHHGPVRAVALAPDCRSGVSAGDDASVRFFQLPDSAAGPGGHKA